MLLNTYDFFKEGSTSRKEKLTFFYSSYWEGAGYYK